MAKSKRQTVTPASRAKRGPVPVLSPMTIAVVAIAALLIVGGLIILGSQGRSSGGPIDISRFPQMGNPDARVTLIEFSDYG